MLFFRETEMVLCFLWLIFSHENKVKVMLFLKEFLKTFSRKEVYLNMCASALSERNFSNMQSAYVIRYRSSNFGRTVLVGQRPMKSLSSVCPCVRPSDRH